MKPVILCVDDESIVLTGLKTQLRLIFGSDYEIETAESGDEAIEIVEEILEDGIEFPLIISDQIMPGMSGDELLEYVYKKSPETLSVMLTGQADANAVGRAVNNAHLYRYLSKPWQKDDLSLTVKAAIKSYAQARKIEEQNLELRKYSEHLEELVEQRTREIFEQKKVIEQKNEDILASINYAKRIQRALLPTKKMIETVDSFVVYLPKDIVSGDFYWFKEKEENTFIVAADCTGHGVPGAFMSMLGISLLNEIVKTETSPAQILNELRKRVIQTLHQSEQDAETQDGMDITISVIDRNKKTLKFAGAYNSLIKINNSEVTVYKVNRMPIGVHVKDNEAFSEQEIKVEPNDIFYMLSDGYPDQFGGEKNKRFMMKRLKSTLKEIYSLNFEEQKQILLNVFDKWRGDNEQLDDVVIVGFKCNF